MNTNIYSSLITFTTNGKDVHDKDTIYWESEYIHTHTYTVTYFKCVPSNKLH